MLQVNDVHYSYPAKYKKVEALHAVNCTFSNGKLYSIIGKPGSGKTALLSLLSGLTVPTEGSIFIDGAELTKTNRNKYRRNRAALISRGINLFPFLTVLENVSYPMELNKVPREEAIKRAKELLDQVGLPDGYADKRPKSLSGAQQLKTAIARAMSMPGNILLLDEPTDNLNQEDTEGIMSLLTDLAYRENYCAIFTTRDIDAARHADTVYELKNGEIISSGPPQILSDKNFQYSFYSVEA